MVALQVLSNYSDQRTTFYAQYTMLYNLYIYLGKKFHRVLLPFLRFGKEKRVRILVVSSDQHILLVRNWFGYQNWSLPGGGVKKGETAESAIVRELHEETGLSVMPSRVSYIKAYTFYESSLPFEANVYCTTVPEEANLSEKKSFEVIARKWHSLGSIPKDLAMPIQEILKETRGGR